MHHAVALEHREVVGEALELPPDSGAQSGANIKFTTRRGGNQYHGSVFYEPRSEQFNANSWTRNAQGLPRLYNRNHEYGGNFGGPLIPFGRMKEKLFFFVNYERVYNPQFVATTVALPTAQAQRGPPARKAPPHSATACLTACSQRAMRSAGFMVAESPSALGSTMVKAIKG